MGKTTLALVKRVVDDGCCSFQTPSYVTKGYWRDGVPYNDMFIDRAMGNIPAGTQYSTNVVNQFRD